MTIPNRSTKHLAKEFRWQQKNSQFIITCDAQQPLYTQKNERQKQKRIGRIFCFELMYVRMLSICLYAKTFELSKQNEARAKRIINYLKNARKHFVPFSKFILHLTFQFKTCIMQTVTCAFIRTCLPPEGHPFSRMPTERGY